MTEERLTEVCGEDTGKDGDNDGDQVGCEAARTHQHLQFRKIFQQFFGPTGIYWSGSPHLCYSLTETNKYFAENS